MPPAELESRGREAVEVAALAGLELDEWQQAVLVDSLRVGGDGRWASFEVGVCVGRQNGKGAILEARELAALFAFGERLVIHSAQQFDTSLEAFNRLKWLVEDTPDFDRQVQRITNSHGEEGITLKSGQRIRYRTRSKGGGRGFTADVLVFDEAMFLAQFAHGALLPTLSARPNPQVWYTGSAVDQEIHEHGLVFARVRERGLEGRDRSLAYFEWSLPFERPELIPDEVADSRESWAEANPAFGLRISEDYLEDEIGALDPRSFAVERLGVGDWPATDGTQDSPVGLDAWNALRDPHSILQDPVCLAFDVSPDRRGAIAAAGRRADGLLHVEIVDHRPGTGWVVRRLVELLEQQPEAVVCDGGGPAMSLVAKALEAGVPVRTMPPAEHGQACGHLVDAVAEKRLRHLGSHELLAAIRGAKTRPYGDSWAWSRKSSSVDISPLVAATLALSAAAQLPDSLSDVRIF